jgi:hypothetical protein
MSERTSLHRLLDLPDGLSKPNAYDLLGLTVGEVGRATIDAALQNAFRKLQERRSTVTQEQWQRAFGLLQQAQGLLTDATKKRSYDQKLASKASKSPSTVEGGGTASTADGSPTAATPMTLSGPDVLASLHQSGDPFSVLPKNDDPFDGMSDEGSVSGASTVPPSIEKPPPLPFDNSHVGSQAASTGAAIGAIPKLVTSRPVKRRSSTNTIVMMLLVALLAGVAGAGGWTLYQRSQRQLANDSSSTNRGSTTDGASSTNEASSTVGANDGSAATDRIMPPVPSSNRSGSTRTSAGSNSNRQIVPPTAMNANADSANADSANADSANADMANEESAMNAGAMDGAGVEGASMPEGMPVEEMAAREGTAEEVAAFERALRECNDVLRGGDWDVASPMAEAVMKGAKSDSQRATASALARLIGFAKIYDQAIADGLGKWKPTESITVGRQEVILVEVKADEVIFRIQGVNRPFPIDRIPPGLADEIAGFDIDLEHPTTIAYRAAWRTLRRKAEPEVIEESIEAWRGLMGKTDEVDVTGLEELVRGIFMTPQ